MPKSFQRGLVSLAIAIVLGSAATGAWLISAAEASPAPACTDTWTGPSSSGDWGTAADWSTGVVPAASDVACWAGGTTIDVTSTDTAATAGSVQGGSLDVSGGEFTLASSSRSSTLDDLTVTGGELEGPASIALSGDFLFDGGSIGVVVSNYSVQYPTSPLTITQTGGGSFQLGQSSCPTEYIDAIITTSSPVDIGCRYVLPAGGSLATTSTVTFAAGSYPAAAGADMDLTAEGFAISGSTVPQDFQVTQDGGTTTIPSGENFAPGTGMLLDSGDVVVNGTLGNGLTLDGGTLSGTGTISSTVTNNDGTVSPGASGSGTSLRISGTYIQNAGGTLQTPVSGAATGDYNQLDVTAGAQLNGWTLELSPTTGYQAAAAVGDSLKVIGAGSVTGTFTTVTSDSPLANGETFSADYPSDNTEVDAVVTAAPASTTSTPSTTTSTPSTSTPSTSPLGPTTTTPTTSSPAVGPLVVGPPVDKTAPSLSGTPLPGDTLTCHPGTWTGIPSFTYQWMRGTTPITGATADTYTVTILDEGSTLTCAVTAHDDGGIVSATSPGVVVAQRGTLRCPKPSGSFSPQQVGPFSLGELRSTARRSFPRWKVIQSGFDNFCLYGGWGIRGAYKHNRFAFLDTANPYYTLKGISPGDTLAALRRKLKLGKVIVIGANNWYVAVGSTSNYVFKSRRGIVDEIGIAIKRDTTGRAAQKRFLSSFKAAA
jgi:hypothetical protein